MGKGLGITDKSKGLHVVIAAGTGVLPFLDLVARMAFTMLKVIPRKERLNEEFELHFYASFRTRKESIGLELLEAMNKAFPGFKLHLRISSET